MASAQQKFDFAATVAAAKANAATTAVMERMKANGWYGTSPTSDDLANSDDDSSSSAKTPAVAGRREPGGEGWRLWQTVNERVKEVTTAVKKRTAGDDGLCESDEEDFAGPGDSHLIRVMKEYYIDRSTSPADLPLWLFPDQQPSRSRAWDASTSVSSRAPAASRSRSSPSVPAARAAEYEPYVSPIAAGRSHTRDTSRGSSSSGSETPAARRFQPSEHGSRTAQKLRQMKSTRGA